MAKIWEMGRAAASHDGRVAEVPRRASRREGLILVSGPKQLYPYICTVEEAVPSLEWANWRNMHTAIGRYRGCKQVLYQLGLWDSWS